MQLVKIFEQIINSQIHDDIGAGFAGCYYNHEESSTPEKNLVLPVYNQENNSYSLFVKSANKQNNLTCYSGKSVDELLDDPKLIDNQKLMSLLLTDKLRFSRLI